MAILAFITIDQTDIYVAVKALESKSYRTICLFPSLLIVALGTNSIVVTL